MRTRRSMASMWQRRARCLAWLRCSPPLIWPMSSPIPGGIGFPRPDGGPAPKTDRSLLAVDRVRFVGEPVAVVVAETSGAAKDAAEAVDGEIIGDVAAGDRSDRRNGKRRPGGVGRCAGQYRLPVEARRCRLRPMQALRSAAHVTRLQFTVSRVTASVDGAARRVGGTWRGWAHGNTRVASVAVSICATAWPAAISRLRTPISACWRPMSAAHSA